VWAQAAGVRKVGLLSITATYTAWPEWRAFVDELARLGFVEGRDVVFVARHAGTYDEPRLSQQLRAAASELVAQRVDAIYAVEVVATARAARQATTSIPIIFDRSWFDPVQIGLVSSLARPGGNVTGNAVLGLELETKAIEALVETVGRAAPIGVVQSPALRSWPIHGQINDQRKSIERALGVTLQLVEVDDVRQLAAQLANLRRQGVRAAKIEDPEEFARRREEIAALFATHRLVALSTEPDFARAGLMIGLGWDVEEIARRSAGYVQRVLRGARPAELPVERMTKFRLIVNRRTARAIGVVLPPALLARADEVIE
jgi:putative ABC transport system substrate-binding protein